MTSRFFINISGFWGSAPSIKSREARLLKPYFFAVVQIISSEEKPRTMEIWSSVTVDNLAPYCHKIEAIRAFTIK